LIQWFQGSKLKTDNAHFDTFRPLVAHIKLNYIYLFQGKNITREAFEELWMEYFVSNDTSAKGNYLFGVPDFM
jgi:hypothetical protein